MNQCSLCFRPSRASRANHIRGLRVFEACAKPIPLRRGLRSRCLFRSPNNGDLHAGSPLFLSLLREFRRVVSVASSLSLDDGPQAFVGREVGHVLSSLSTFDKGDACLNLEG